MSTPPLALTRTANLTDFPSCVSVAQWQQQHAIDAYHRWQDRFWVEGGTLCLNWGAATFRAFGDDPIYRSRHDPIDAFDPGTLAIIYNLSVLDRIDGPCRFLRQQATALHPGGLIVCTFGAWDATGLDCAIGHELRARLYDRDSWGELIQWVKRAGLCPFGGVDLRYQGHTLGDHTLATLVLIKKVRN